MSFGDTISARAIASSWRSPPDRVRGLLVPPLGQERKQLEHPVLGLRRGRAIEAIAADVEILDDRQRLEGVQKLRNIADSQAHAGGRPQGLNFVALEEDAAPGGADIAEDALDQGRLAAAIRAEDRHDLARGGRDIDARG